MTKKQKRAFHLSRLTVLPAILISMIFPASQSAYAATESYDLYIGSTQVTSDNANNIFGEKGADGNPTASYDAATKTLTLNGVHIEADSYHEAENEHVLSYGVMDRYSMYCGAGMVTKLVINGENSFESAMADICYRYGAKKLASGLPADANGDGKIDLDDADVEIDPGQTGIVLWTGDELTITGTGTLTSKAAIPTPKDKCKVYDYDDFNQVGVTLEVPDGTGTVYAGTAMTVLDGSDYGTAILKIGENKYEYPTPISCTGPKLVLTGMDQGAAFYISGLNMKGGTVIAEATNKDKGVGICLADDYYFEAGTVAAKGKYDTVAGEGGAFENTGPFVETGAVKSFGSKPVYPKGLGINGNPLGNIDGWGVVGMTADGFKEQTDAVLREIGVIGKYHTDTVPDSGPNIDVQGFTKDATIYSVDVEWGAMTFEYEASSWDPEQHKSIEGRGWLVYDSVNDEVLGGDGEAAKNFQDAINRVKITNHSNAPVYAALTYTGEAAYSGTTGEFADTKTASENVKATWDGANNYFTLKTAATDAEDQAVAAGSAGTPSVGTVYFMPTGISDDNKTDGITKWTKIGKITVAITTEDPNAAP